MTETAIPAWAVPARAHKEAWCRDFDPDMTPPFLLLEEAGRPLAVVFLLETDRDEQMRVVASAVFGLMPDHVVLVHDTFVARRDHGMHADEFRAALKPGDMAKMAAEGGRERGTVEDAMLAIRCDRDGTVEARTFRYRMEGKAVAWLDDPAGGLPPSRPEGFIPESLAMIMTRTDSALDEARVMARYMRITLPPDPVPMLRRTFIKYLESKGTIDKPLDPALREGGGGR